MIFSSTLILYAILPKMLKTLWKIEEKVFNTIVRMVRGKNPYTLDHIKILYESPHYIVVNKFHDVVMNDVDRTRLSVERQLERLYPDLANKSLAFGYYFVHRLDYATSGVLCVAKHKKANQCASKAFENRTTEKYYLAVLRGYVSQNYLLINEPIGKDTREKFQDLRMSTPSLSNCSKHTRKATTHLIVLGRGICYNYPATKVLFRPITGRRHQLRLHSNVIGNTIVGDFTYSNRRDIMPHRMFLHAYRLKIDKNPLENIDIITEDPFSTDDPINRWDDYQEVLSLDEGMYILSNKN